MRTAISPRLAMRTLANMSGCQSTPDQADSEIGVGL